MWWNGAVEWRSTCFVYVKLSNVWGEFLSVGGLVGTWSYDGGCGQVVFSLEATEVYLSG